jgi:hypothetical protein
VGEDGRTILGDVFIEQDASLDTAQQLRQGGLARERFRLAPRGGAPFTPPGREAPSRAGLLTRPV